MKTMKIATIATAITLVLIALCGIATANTYEMTAVVIAWEQIGDTDLYNVTVIDANGEQWAFFGEEEDAHIGNLYRITMLDMSNEHEEDDEIKDVELIDCLDAIDTARFLRGAK